MGKPKRVPMRRRPKSWIADRLPEDLRALTIQQPFAWAVVSGFKLVENRSRPPPLALIGKVIAIHAGSGTFYRADLERVGDLVGVEAPTEFDVGAIVGFARLVRWTNGPRKLTKRERRWYHPNSHAWLLDDVYELQEPVECGGQLGFWRVKGSALRSLRNKLR